MGVEKSVHTSFTEFKQAYRGKTNGFRRKRNKAKGEGTFTFYGAKDVGLIHFTSADGKQGLSMVRTNPLKKRIIVTHYGDYPQEVQSLINKHIDQLVTEKRREGYKRNIKREQEVDIQMSHRIFEIMWMHGKGQALKSIVQHLVNRSLISQKQKEKVVQAHLEELGLAEPVPPAPKKKAEPKVAAPQKTKKAKPKPKAKLVTIEQARTELLQNVTADLVDAFNGKSHDVETALPERKGTTIHFFGKKGLGFVVMKLAAYSPKKTQRQPVIYIGEDKHVYIQGQFPTDVSTPIINGMLKSLKKRGHSPQVKIVTGQTRLVENLLKKFEGS